MNSRARVPAPVDVDEYFERLSEANRAFLGKMRALIRSAVPPEATENISYGMPGFKYKGALLWYAVFKNHCGLYPTPAVIETFKDELKGYEVSKGAIRFPLNKPLPAALIKKIVKARVAQQDQKKPRAAGTS